MNEQVKIQLDPAHAESAYLTGGLEPATSSVLISNSMYLNNPLFRDVYAQLGLKRDSLDLPDAYLIPTLKRAMGEVTDPARRDALIQAERKRNPEFDAWLDERFISDIPVESLAHYPAGSLGATVHDFLIKTGFKLDFAYPGEPRNDWEFVMKRSLQYHDIWHLVTGFDASQVGEMALIVANFIMNCNYFTEELAHEMNKTNVIVLSTTVSRLGLHYHRTFPAMFEAMSRGYSMGQKQNKPLYLYKWEDYFPLTVAEVRKMFHFEDGPEPGSGYWDWVVDASHG